MAPENSPQVQPVQLDLPLSAYNFPKKDPNETAKENLNSDDPFVVAPDSVNGNSSVAAIECFKNRHENIGRQIANAQLLPPFIIPPIDFKEFEFSVGM